MPSAFDYFSTLAPAAINGILQRRSVGNATNQLTGGVDRARGVATGNAAELQALYDRSRTSQQSLLQPWQTAGNANAAMLNQGLQPGGGLADPYGKEFSFEGKDLATEPGYQFALSEGNKAIEATRRAMGTRFSGGAAKELTRYGTDYANTKFNDAFDRSKVTFDSNETTFRKNQSDRYDRLKAAADQGFDATKAGVDVEQNYTNESGRAQLITSQQLQQLELDKAEAEATGDIEKANTISRAIETGVKGLQGLKALSSNGSALQSVAGSIPGVSAATTAALPGALAALPIPGSAASVAAGGAASLAGIPGLSVAPTIGGVGGASTAAGTAGAAGTGGGGFAATTTAFLTNPVTIGVGLGIIAVTSLLKSQAKWEANEWTGKFQTKFDAGMSQINQQFSQLATSGQLSKADATALRSQVAEAMKGYEAKRVEFSKGGKDKKRVSEQALQTFNQYYGAGGSKTLSWMDSVIAGLA